MLNLLRLPLFTVSACANSRVIPDTGERYACRSDALIFTADAVPAFGWPQVHFEVNRVVRARIEPRTARLAVRMGKIRVHPFHYPQQQAYRHARYVNGGAVRRVASALRVTAVARAGRIGGIGTGNVKTSALRAGSTSPPAGSNGEQALHSRILKFLPIPLTPSPARRIYDALLPGLDSHAVVQRNGS